MYIACANFEDTISFYGEFKNPLGAIVEFIEGGEFNNYCDSYGIKSGEIVEVKVFKAIYKNDDNEEYFEEGWEWILGKQVGTIEITYEGLSTCK